MRRDIRFRGKRIDNGEWIYGSLLDGDIIVAGPVDADEDYIGLGEWSSVDPETVGQYTGLKDRNGKEIYEGDLLDISDRVFPQEVDMDDGCYGTDEFALYELVRCKNRTIEVIGNRWDNPDLLEGGYE